jgi:hypothetical protein
MKVVDPMLGTEGIGGEGKSGYRSDNAWFEECHGGGYNGESPQEAKEDG